MTSRVRWLAMVIAVSAVASGACGEVSMDAPAPEPTEVTDPREAEVLAVVQKFFETMTDRDAAGAEQLLLMDGQFHSLRPSDDGAVVRTVPLASYVEGLPTGTRRQVERMWDPVVRVDDHIAMVWTPYDFRNDDELSHCGIDVFSLLRTDEGWKISGVTYTVEPDGCARLGQPGRPRP